MFTSIDEASFTSIEKWVEKVTKQCGSIPIALVQNKSDTINDKQVSHEKIESLSTKLGLPLFVTSVKENSKVDEIFNYLIDQHLKGSQEEKSKKAETENQIKKVEEPKQEEEAKKDTKKGKKERKEGDQPTCKCNIY